MGSHSLLQGELLNPGTEPRSPALQADSLPSEPSEEIVARLLGSFLEWSLAYSSLPNALKIPSCLLSPRGISKLTDYPTLSLSQCPFNEGWIKSSGFLFHLDRVSVST